MNDSLNSLTAELYRLRLEAVALAVLPWDVPEDLKPKVPSRRVNGRNRSEWSNWPEDRKRLYLGSLWSEVLKLRTANYLADAK